MTSKDPVDLLLAHVKQTLRDGPFTRAPGWSDMGAVICDAVLQRRMNYETVVRPRINRLISEWPEANTASRFRQHIADRDLQATLDFDSQIRLTTIRDLTEYLVTVGIETHKQLHAWLDNPAHARELQTIRWIGPKTVAYLGILVGRSDVAVDTRLRGFAAEAGVREPDAKLRNHLAQVADRLGCDPAGLDHTIWTYMGMTIGTKAACDRP